MGRSQRHLREIQGYDSSGQSKGADGGFETNPGVISFSGSIADQTGNQSVAFSMTVANNFVGSDLPFTYALQAGTLPSQVTLDTNTGVISGTPDTIQTQTGIVIRATDGSGDTADTNAFEIDILA